MARVTNRDFGTALNCTGGKVVTSTTGPVNLNTSLANAYSLRFKVLRDPGGNFTLFYPGYDRLDVNFETGSKKIFIWFLKSDSSQGLVVKSPNSVADGSWHQVIINKTSSAIRVILDGVLLISQAQTLGTLATSGARFGTGISIPVIFDDIFSWDRSLTTDEETAPWLNTSIPTGAKLWWKFDETTGLTALDSSGNGNNGTITGATYTSDVPSIARSAAANRFVVPKVPQTALSFNGSNAQVLSSVDPFVSGDTQATVSFWAKIPSSTKGSDQFLIGTGGGNTSTGFEVRRYLDNRLYVYPPVSGFSFIPLYDQWNHYTLTIIQSGAMAIYENSTLKASSTHTGGSLVNGVLTVGRQATVSNSWFGGLIRNIRIYKSALTQAQISSLYYNPDINPVSPSLVWTTNEGAGTTTYDTSGNNNHGTITGATYTKDTPSQPRTKIGGNLVVNGDFEYAPPFVAAQTIAGGTYIDGTAGGSTTNKNFGAWGCNVNNGFPLRFDSSTSSSGTTSFKVSTTSTNSYALLRKGIATSGSMIGDGVSVLPNTSYVLSWAMKTNYVSGSAGGTYITTIEGNGDGGSLTTTRSATQIQTTTGWTNYQMTITTGSTTRFMQMEFGVQGNSGAATLIMDAWFDDITLTPTVNTVRSVA